MDPNLPLDVNRNNAVQLAFDQDCEYIFFLDHDNIPHEDTLVRLLTQNVDVIGALYFERKYPHLPLVYTFEDDFKTIQVQVNYPSAPLVRCDVIGLGCSLIKMDVFNRIEKPWFAYEYKGYTWGTEDIAFFHKLKDSGIDVHIDTEKTCGHLTEYVVDEGDWEYHKSAYLRIVNDRAAELGTQKVLLDKAKDILIKSPSAKD